MRTLYALAVFAVLSLVLALLMQFGNWLAWFCARGC